LKGTIAFAPYRVVMGESSETVTSS